MNRLLLASLCIASALAAETVKNSTAGGYYDSGSSYGAAAAPTQGYAAAPTQGYAAYGYASSPPLQDRNVCDLDASVLLVTDSSRRGHNRAVRVRCSEIANYDEDSCNTCCQHAARRDRNLQNSAMFGFLAVTDDSKRDDNTDDDEETEENTDDGENARFKRGSYHGDRDHHHGGEVEPTRLEKANWKPDAHFRNTKCVCCAPKRELPPPQPIYAQPQPVYYQAPAQYAQPMYQQQAQPIYQAQAPPSYSAPAQAPPSYSAPAQSAPTYSAPAQAPSTYSAPAQSAPTYSAPAQAPSSYQPQPIQAAQPAYEAPAQSPVSY